MITQIPSLAQGVSQQAPILRRGSQVEEGVNLMSSETKGLVPRNGIKPLFWIPNLKSETDWVYDLFRSKDEKYVLTVKSGKLGIYRIDTGIRCALTVVGGADRYLTTMSSRTKDVLRAVTVEDVTYILNTERAPLMDTIRKSPFRPKEAIIHAKAGSYKTLYRVALRVDGDATIYTWSYETPDNQTTTNRPYVASSAIIATLHRAMTNGGAQNGGDIIRGAETSSDVVGPSLAGVDNLLGGSIPGETTASPPTSGYVKRPASGATLTSLGFSSQINGSCIRIWRTDAKDFKVETDDGSGGTSLICLKGTAQSFSDLPRVCFPGVVLAIRGAKDNVADDYYVVYAAEGNASSTWTECVAPNTILGFDKTTLPIRLINTGPDTFILDVPEWQDRVCGDGVDTAEDPSFIGSVLTDIGYDQGRLQFLHEGGTVWSKRKRPHQWFRDTNKTDLATDPVDISLTYNRPTILQRIVQAPGVPMAWAQGAQFAITSGDQGFKATSVDSKAILHQEFSLGADPVPVSTYVMFAADRGPYVQVRSLALQGARILSDTSLTDHVPSYIKGPLSHWAWGALATMAVCGSATDPSVLKTYQWSMGPEGNVLRSAWSSWKLPEDSRCGWSRISGMNLYLFLDYVEGSYFSTVSLSEDLVDTEDANAGYLTRLDLEQVITIPASIQISGPQSLKLTLRHTPTTAPVAVILSGSRRGLEVPSSGTLPTGDGVGCTFPSKSFVAGEIVKVGWKIHSVATLGTLLPRTPDDDVIPTTRDVYKMTLTTFGLRCVDTAYTFVQVEQSLGGGLEPITHRTQVGSVTLGLEFKDGVRLVSTSLSTPVGTASERAHITLHNDSPFPSAWTGLFYEHT